MEEGVLDDSKGFFGGEMLGPHCALCYKKNGLGKREPPRSDYALCENGYVPYVIKNPGCVCTLHGKNIAPG